MWPAARLRAGSSGFEESKAGLCPDPQRGRSPFDPVTARGWGGFLQVKSHDLDVGSGEAPNASRPYRRWRMSNGLIACGAKQGSRSSQESHGIKGANAPLRVW